MDNISDSNTELNFDKNEYNKLYKNCKVTCTICNCSFNRSHLYLHKRSNKHLQLLEKYSTKISKDEYSDMKLELSLRVI
jgi:hypothetical protein